VFALEVIGLGAIMGLWNPAWLWLAVVFVDWDRLNAWLVGGGAVANASANVPRSSRRTLSAWVATLAVVLVATAFAPRVAQQLKIYPFTNYPMFSAIRAAQPYDRHLPYAVAGDAFEIVADRPISTDVQQWFDHGQRGLHAVSNPAVRERRMRAILAAAQARFPELAIRTIRHRVAVFQTPAYPAPARFERYAIAIAGEIDRDGSYRALAGRLEGGRVVIAGEPRLGSFGCYLGGTVAFACNATAVPRDTQFVVAQLDGEPWLVARR
jgi:hypothetical protein